MSRRKGGEALGPDLGLSGNEEEESKTFSSPTATTLPLLFSLEANQKKVSFPTKTNTGKRLRREKSNRALPTQVGKIRQ